MNQWVPVGLMWVYSCQFSEKALAEVFKTIDTDRSGNITADEVWAVDVRH